MLDCQNYQIKQKQLEADQGTYPSLLVQNSQMMRDLMNLLQLLKMVMLNAHFDMENQQIRVFVYEATCFDGNV